MINFRDKFLIQKYGSWVRVQVAFYDFLFTEANKICEHHLNEELLQHWKESDLLYERFISVIQNKWPTPESAWSDFLLSQSDE